MATSGKDGKPTEEKPAEEKKKGGFLKGLGAKLDKVGKEIGKGVDSAATSVNKTVDENWKSALLGNFRTNMKVQLISKTSGKALQYVDGVLNGLGAEGPEGDIKASTWLVLNDGNNIVRLHIDNNYLAIEDGKTVVKHYSDPANTGPETRFRLQQTGQYIMLESVAQAKTHIGVLADGSLKSALITGKELDAQFGVRLIYSPYPPPEKK